MTRRTTAATLRRYRAEWQAALAQRDYAKTRRILGVALSTISTDTLRDLDYDTRSLNALLALDRRLESIREGEAPMRMAFATEAFAASATTRFREAWREAVKTADCPRASKIVRDAIAAVSRALATRARSQQVLIARLKKLQRVPLRLSSSPSRCAFCGGISQPRLDPATYLLCVTSCPLGERCHS
jgi:hypothetical protein